MISARRPQGNGYDGSGGAAPRGNSGSAGISGDGGTGEAGRSPLSCGRRIMDGMHGTLRNAPGRGEGTGAVVRQGGGEAGKGPGRDAVTGAAPDTRAGGAGHGEGRAPGRTRQALRLAAAGKPQRSGGRPSRSSGAEEGRPRAKLQRPTRTGIRNAPRGFAARRSAERWRGLPATLRGPMEAMTADWGGEGRRNARRPATFRSTGRDNTGR